MKTFVPGSRVLCRASETWLAISLLTAILQGYASAQGNDVSVLRSTGQTIRGELLVATDRAVIVRTQSNLHNIWWQGDSAYAVSVPLSEVEKVIIEGNSNILTGGGIGLLMGAVLGALMAEKGWTGAGAAAGGLLGGLAGVVVGALSSQREKVIDRNTRDGFSSLPDYARYGTTTPPILKHLE